MIKVLINGASGKMGMEAVKAVGREPDLALVGAAGRKDRLDQLIQTVKPDVVVDLTHPSVVVENTRTILENGAHAVIGTTGLTPRDLDTLGKLAHSKSVGLLVCPNFAIGAVLMMKFAAEASKYMPKVEIIEYHHDQKADAPSGTAIKTAEWISVANPQVNAQLLDEVLSVAGVRGGVVGLVPIHSVRLPGFVASQEVILGALGQTLKIRHDTINRDSFMPGVILSIRKVIALRGLVYGLEHIL